MNLLTKINDACEDVYDQLKKRPKRPDDRNGVIRWRWNANRGLWEDPYPNLTAKELGTNKIVRFADPVESEISRREKRNAMKQLKKLSR